MGKFVTMVNIIIKLKVPETVKYLYLSELIIK